MSRIINDFIKDEYTKFHNELVSEWGVDDKNLNKFAHGIKPIFKRQISLACIATIIGQRSQRNEYAEGIVEVTYLGVVLAVKGLENTSYVLLRQTIELTLKHIYFSTHPVEYSWACSREGYRDLTFQVLIDFIRKTDQVRKFSKYHKICDKIEKLFGILSRHVHVHSKRFMGYRKIGSAHQINDKIIKKLNQTTKEICPILIVLLIIFFPKKYSRASEIEKRLIRNVLPKNIRDSVDKYIRNYVSI